ncbi:YczE/YyaS/YitT family protein [Vulcanibacillus modesticaldus]|uniref:YczE/YyaS/YitT family protein n=1 Tax=Vulcanibacillus modesticaldus TaxID=337097 RepID=UPI00114CCF70|nr:YitT family protein [Vulcanibacillus modesticaldus]
MGKTNYLYQLSIFFLGIIILSLGIAMIIEANLGVSSWDVLHIGLYNILGLTIGTWSIIVSLTVIIITFILDKKMISIGTVLNMIFVGVFIDLFLYLLPTMERLFFQYMYLFVGILLMGMGAGLYITANLGAGPRDSLMLVLSKKYQMSIGKIKTIMELLVLIVGWILGGPVYIGTLIVSVLIGPIIQFFIKLWDTYFVSQGIVITDLRYRRENKL